MNSLRAALLSTALLFLSAPAAAVCTVGSPDVCRDTITKVSLATNNVVSVFVTAGDHETIGCTDIDGLDLNPSSVHYDQAYQAILLAAASFITVELSVDASCNITTVTIDP
jgi:hypothetical protein